MYGAVQPVSNVARVAYSAAKIFDAGVLECRFMEAQAFAEQVAERRCQHNGNGKQVHPGNARPEMQSEESPPILARSAAPNPPARAALTRLMNS